VHYKPTVKGNRWETATTSNNNNGGIHDQEAFRSGVAMIEAAINEWSSPILTHVILTKGTILDYDGFINRVKRYLAGTKYSFKGCTEEDGPDSKKGCHRHYMWIVDLDDSSNNPFDLDDDTSAISRALTATRRTAPEFEVTVAQPRRHDTPYIPLTPYSLQDAADYFSYIVKQRSKQACHRYISSRVQRNVQQ